MRKGYKKILIITTFALLLLALLGVSYAFFDKTFSIDENASLVETDEFISINYLDGKSFDIKEFNKDDLYSKKISITISDF